MSFKISNGKHPLLESLGLQRQMFGAGIEEAAEGAVSGAVNAGSSFWNEDYTGFQHAANGISGVVSGMTNIGIAGAFGYAAHRNMASLNGITGKGTRVFEDVFKTGKGVYAIDTNKAAVRTISGNALPSNSITAKAIEKTGKPGYWSQPRATGLNPVEGGKFTAKGNALSRGIIGWKGGVAMAGAMLASYAFGHAASIAGQLLDESHLAYNQAQMHTYDTRMFNNRGMQEWGMQNQQAAMQTLVPFENNNMSIARVYHSRG